MANYFIRHEQRNPQAFFSAGELADVAAFYAAQPDAAVTPLRTLPALAAALGVGELMVKDESLRLGLPAFKIAGARYAMAVLAAAGGSAMRDVACATAGNHGRAVAHAARAHGRLAHVYVPSGTALVRIDALAREGADVIVTSGDYDAAVAQMTREARARGWTIVSDTAFPGGDDTVPRAIMAGYTQIFEEAARAWGARPPDLIIVQAGVGSLAGALAGWLIARFGAAGPHLVIAEPAGSACVLASLAANAPVTLPNCSPTAMVGLRCARVSPLAWPPIRDRADAAVSVAEEDNTEMRQRLARPRDGDPRILAGASGTCGLAALAAISHREDLVTVRRGLGVTRATRVLVFVTEGRTDDDDVSAGPGER